MKKIYSVYLFPTGMLAAFDIEGEQLSEYQGSYSIKKHMKIFENKSDNCEIHGFEILPEGFHKIVEHTINCLKSKK